MRIVAGRHDGSSPPRPRRARVFGLPAALIVAGIAVLSTGAAWSQTQILSDNFEGATPLDTNWDHLLGNCNAVTVTTAQSHSPGHSLLYTPNGGDTTGDCNHTVPSLHKFYLSMWFWVSPTINPCYAPGHHTFRFFTSVPTGGNTYRQFDTNINSGTGSSCATGPVVLNLDPLFGGYEPGSGTDAYLHAAELQRGAWTRVEVLFDEGTPGGANGSLMVWYTDSAGVHAWPTHGGVPDTGQSYVGSSGPDSPMTTFKVVTNFDLAAPGDYWYVDDVQVWDGCPSTGASCSGSSGPDTTPPVRSNAAPSGSLPFGTTSATLSLTTNEAATCRYSTTPNVSYSAMTKTFGTTGGTSQSTTVTGLANGGTYNYYVRCSDTSGNANVDDYAITFSVTSTTSPATCASPPPGTIFCDDFEDTSTTLSSRYTDYDDGGGRFVVSTTQAHSGTHAMSARYDPGQENSGYLWYAFGRNPHGSKTASSTDFTDIYWRIWMYVAPSFQGNPQKFTRARVIIPDPSGCTPSYSMTDIATGHIWQGSSLNLATDPATGIGTDGSTIQTCGFNDFNHYRWLGLNEGASNVYDSSHQGRWQCVEAHMKLNTPGASDGVLEEWVDGTLDARSPNLNFRGSNTSYGINLIALENWWNGGASPQTQYRYMDDFMVSTQRIGCAASGGDLTPPAGVQQLRRADKH